MSCYGIINNPYALPSSFRRTGSPPAALGAAHLGHLVFPHPVAAVVLQELHHLPEVRQEEALALNRLDPIPRQPPIAPRGRRVVPVHHDRVLIVRMSLRRHWRPPTRST